MQRRDFLLMTAAITLALPLAAKATTTATYSPELLAAELAAGKTVLLDFTASWCSSCQAQGRSLRALRAENPGYDAAISFIDVDWDTWGKSDLAKQFGIRSRGSLVILRGDKVLAQTFTHSQKADLKAMLDKAAAAA